MSLSSSKTTQLNQNNPTSSKWNKLYCQYFQYVSIFVIYIPSLLSPFSSYLAPHFPTPAGGINLMCSPFQLLPFLCSNQFLNSDSSNPACWNLHVFFSLHLLELTSSSSLVQLMKIHIDKTTKDHRLSIHRNQHVLGVCNDSVIWMGL